MVFSKVRNDLEAVLYCIECIRSLEHEEGAEGQSKKGSRGGAVHVTWPQSVDEHRFLDVNDTDDELLSI